MLAGSFAEMEDISIVALASPMKGISFALMSVRSIGRLWSRCFAKSPVVEMKQHKHRFISAELFPCGKRCAVCNPLEGIAKKEGFQLNQRVRSRHQAWVWLKMANIRSSMTL